MWQIWQFFKAKFANFCGKFWQNLGFQMTIFCNARFGVLGDVKELHHSERRWYNILLHNTVTRIL